MLHVRTTWLAALVCGCLLAAGAQARANDKKKADDAPAIFSKTDKLDENDPKDTKLKGKPCKTYKVELAQGKTYRIDAKSSDFDTFLRLEDSTGKEVAFNDDVNPPALDSRIIYRAPKSGQYRMIVTCFDGKTGEFKLDMVAASAKEAAEAELIDRIASVATSTAVQRQQLVKDVTKSLQDKGEDLNINDAKAAFMLANALEDEVDIARSAYKDFIKIFSGAANKQVAGVSRFFEQSLKKLDIIGKTMEITGKTIDGKDFDLAKLKGKVVLVDFWGTWCPPCVAEMPNIKDAYEKYNKRGFEVIGVAQDKDDEVVTKFMESRKLPWSCINIEDSRKLVKMHGITAYPSPFLIDQEGRVVSLRARGPQLEVLLEKMLSTKK